MHTLTRGFLLSHPAGIALSKMGCAYSSYIPVTGFYSSPSDFSLAYGPITLDLVTFLSLSFELMAPPGPSPLASLLLLLVPLSLAAKCRLSLSVCHQAPRLSVYFSLAISSGTIYGLPPLP